MSYYPSVYALSLKFAPPSINLRQAMIKDYFGDDSYATRAIQHRAPEDVSREDLDFYGWIYAFMEFEDLLFYLYPIALEFEKDNQLSCIDGFLYSLDSKIEKVFTLCSEDREGIASGLRWIWYAGGSDHADWMQCKNLQNYINVTTFCRDIE